MLFRDREIPFDNVRLMLEEFGKERYGVDVLKVEVPIQMEFDWPRETPFSTSGTLIRELVEAQFIEIEEFAPLSAASRSCRRPSHSASRSQSAAIGTAKRATSVPLKPNPRSRTTDQAPI